MQINPNQSDKEHNEPKKNLMQILIYWFITSAILLIIIYLIFQAILT